MADFRLDESKSFTENCDSFLKTLQSVDAEMASILRNNWDALVVVVCEGERDAKARGEFNTAVATALDALVAPPAEEDGA